MPFLNNFPGRSLRRLGQFVFIISAICLSAGCGSEEYERRLGETVKYFEYLETVNAAVTPTPWNEWGVSLRTPLQFQLMPPPPKPSEDEEADEDAPAGNAPENALADGAGEGEAVAPPIDDPRQPPFVDVHLEGLIGAWRAPVETSVENEIRQSTAYLYAFSNHQRFLDFEDNDRSPPPVSYEADFMTALASGLHVPSPMAADGALTAGEGANWESEQEKFPRKIGYFPSKRFTIWTITVEKGIDDLPTKITLYQHNVGDIQLTLMTAVPGTVDPREHIDDRLEYTLETMSVSSDKPTNRKAIVPGAASSF